MSGDEINHMVRNRHLVESLERSLRSGSHGLSVVPGLLKRLLEEGSWREFTTQREELVRYERFADFVSTPPLKGLGSDLGLIRRVIGNDVEALDLLDRALQNPVGTNVASNNVTSQPAGNQRDKALRKLRKDAPELHEQVLAGSLTAHAAMVKAGYRPKTFTVRADNAASAARTLRKHLDPRQLAELAALLARPEDEGTSR